VTVAHFTLALNSPQSHGPRDIVIAAAIGRPHFLGANHIGEMPWSVDVGINRIERSPFAKGFRIVGDVDYDAIADDAPA